MMDFLIGALNVKTLTMLFAAVAAAATVLTLAMPLVLVNPLDKRMRAVALEREKIRQRERERLSQENQKVKLRQTPKQYVQTVVDRFNLSKWVGQEEARLKLVQAGYRGQAPYITYLFVRMVTPVACFLFAFDLSVCDSEVRSACDDQARHLFLCSLHWHAAAALAAEEQDQTPAVVDQAGLPRHARLAADLR
jgi:hypothetical protein